MNTLTLLLMLCLCLVCFLLGMLTMSGILHPHRQEAKRLRKQNAAYQRYQQEIRKTNK